ncbi:hypothetical protein KBA41_09730 [Candidatus Ozemobacteraceae bacterium]|nr:hypothetical protein [Candidatus Ozemobacteraceae bacterium]
MGGMNDNDPFAESLRNRLPLPPVSDALLVRLERRAVWSQPRLQPLIVIGLTLAFLACLVYYIVSNPSTPVSRTSFPEADPASLPIAVPANIPVAFAPTHDEKLECGLSIISRHRLEREPAFNFALDSVTPHGEGRQLAL